MKKTTIIIIVLVLLFIIACFIFFSLQIPNKTIPQSQDKNNNLLNPSSNDSSQTNSAAGAGNSQASGNQGTAGSEGGGGGGSEGNTGGTETPEESQLPSDINTTECGFYFAGYEICAGTCQLGTCRSEGRSCYCQS